MKARRMDCKAAFCIAAVILCVAWPISLRADDGFDGELERALTPRQLELLLTKYPDNVDKIIPRLEAAILAGIKKKGAEKRFVIREVVPDPGSSGSITFEQVGSDYINIKPEFSSDELEFSPSMSGLGPHVPRGSGSVHRFVGKISVSDKHSVVGEGDKANRLTFCLLKNMGYVYMRGKGRVTSKNGSEVKLGYSKP